MRSTIDFFRHERRARLFLAAHAQSSLGTGAGYVALLLVAYQRFPSPWAISLVLVADLVPAMALGPLFGAAADRWSRRRCAVVADLMRAVALVGLGLVHGFGATLALALLAGAGTGLWGPAALAGLPSLVAPKRLPAATSLFGTIADLGHTLGPALAAAVLLVATPSTLIVANGLTFAMSAAALAAIPYGGRPAGGSGEVRRPSLLREAREGLRASAALPGVGALLAASGAIVLFAGLFNVAELLLATQDLSAGASGFSALVAVFGLGVAGGSLVGSVGGSLGRLKRRFLLGVLVVAAGFLAAAVAPSFAAALVAFAIAGIGNGLVLVHERLLIQSAVPDGLMARVFGVKDALTAWAFGLAFVAGAPLLSILGTRETLLLAGAGGVAVWAVSLAALAHIWTTGRRTRFVLRPTSQARRAATPSR